VVQAVVGSNPIAHLQEAPRDAGLSTVGDRVRALVLNGGLGGAAGQDLAWARVQVACAMQFDDSLQVLLAPILLALGPLAEIAVVLLSLARSSSHFVTPRGSPL
jgi:hypothetical protein